MKGPKLLPEKRIPLLEISLPEVRLPAFPPRIGKLEDRQIEALRYALMDDLGTLIPWAGDVLSDTAIPEVQAKMSSEEFHDFQENNKWLPSTIAALKVFAERNL